MPTRETPPAGAPCWVDLMTSDPQRSRAFYRELFGWSAEEPAEEFGGYFNFERDGVRIAGCMPSQAGSGMPDAWSVYLATDDARKTLDAAIANGAQVLVEPMKVGDFGTSAYLVDPTGAPIGIWQPDRYPGFRVFGEANAPAWFELQTRNYNSAVEFYRTVFGWDTHVAGDTDEFRYTTLGEGEGQLAGIMDAAGFLPAGVPSHWSVYFGTDDTDAALAKTVQMGGSVLQPAFDTPYGRLATALDPTGAQFKLISPNTAMPASTSG